MLHKYHKNFDISVINGIQYQFLNASPRTTSPSTGVQLPPGQKYIVTPTSQTRPVLLQQLGAPNQQIMLRGINNAPVTVVPRHMGPTRPPANMGANGNTPRVAASIAVRPSPASVLGANSNAQRKFILVRAYYSFIFWKALIMLILLFAIMRWEHVACSISLRCL